MRYSDVPNVMQAGSTTGHMFCRPARAGYKKRGVSMYGQLPASRRFRAISSAPRSGITDLEVIYFFWSLFEALMKEILAMGVSDFSMQGLIVAFVFYAVFRSVMDSWKVCYHVYSIFPHLIRSWSTLAKAYCYRRRHLPTNSLLLWSISIPPIQEPSHAGGL